ncbi:hypothetical protein SAMN06297129_3141 [Pseudooceanicola antarcticus]|uniref:Uncharacterized protein n=1 Tax=Pseudooceanicola antarcticus TaxID=1247613 RepID=A0A285J7R6_9RHOB|nr:hypothetical protein SAMN06297129_3141 [Pseudooceanicola antarcticus]
MRAFLRATQVSFRPRGGAKAPARGGGRGLTGPLRDPVECLAASGCANSQRHTGPARHEAGGGL